MTNADIETLKKLCLLSPQALHRQLVYTLQDFGYNIKDLVITKQYIMAAGDLPVCLIAHLDTVFDQNKCKDKEIYLDTEHQVMWSPQGLGTDDRAGVFAILKLLKMGYKPYIIFTQDEELGCLGAKALVRRYPKCPWKKLKYILQLDRRGEKDCVFYDCDNPDFTKYVESFGFETEWGTFSDISEIAPAWGIAAANLSVGYWDEHTYCERVALEWLEQTIEKVKKMLDMSNKAQRYEYIEIKRPSFDKTTATDMCILCGGPIDEAAEYACVCSTCSAPWH